MISRSVLVQYGDALSRILPFKKKGSWGMALRRERMVWRGRVVISMPSIRTVWRLAMISSYVLSNPAYWNSRQKLRVGGRAS